MLQNATAFFLVIAITASVHIMAIKIDIHLTQPIGFTIIHERDTLFLLADDNETMDEVLQRLQLTQTKF